MLDETVLEPPRAEKKDTVLVVDDEPDIVAVLRKRFSDAGYSVCSAYGGTEAIAKAKEMEPDLIVLDIMMPGTDGIEVKKQLNQDETTAHIPVIFLTAKISTADKVEGLRLRADDYVTKPFDLEELLARVDAALSRRKRYETLSMMDALTGCPNADYFKKELAIAFNLAKRYHRKFSVEVVDIDDFKKINDTFGHQAGDDILRAVAERMKHVLRKSDVLTRYGGDEFALILREDDQEQAAIALRRLKNEVEGKIFTVGNEKENIPVSLSIGGVTYADGFSNEAELFELADRNMYQDKRRKKRFQQE